MGIAPPSRWSQHPLGALTWSGMGSSRGFRGMSALAPGALPSFPSSLILVFTVFFSHIFSFLYSGSCWYCSGFNFPLVKYVIPEALPQPLVGSAMASSWSVLESAGIDPAGHRGNFQQLLTDSTAVPSSSKTLTGKPNTNVIKEKILFS